MKKKIHARQLTLKKYSCYGLKRIHTRNLITKKNSCGSKIPHSHNFSNGPSLINFIVFMIELLSDGHTTYVSGHHETHVSNENEL